MGHILPSSQGGLHLDQSSSFSSQTSEMVICHRLPSLLIVQWPCAPSAPPTLNLKGLWGRQSGRHPTLVNMAESLLEACLGMFLQTATLRVRGLFLFGGGSYLFLSVKNSTF